MKKATKPSATPAQIREVLAADPSRVSDAELVALVVGIGTRCQSRGRRHRSWSSVALGEELYAAAGGRLPDLVNETPSAPSSRCRGTSGSPTRERQMRSKRPGASISRRVAPAGSPVIGRVSHDVR